MDGPLEQAATPPSELPTASPELAEQAQLHAAQQAAEDAQLPESISDGNLDDSGTGEIAADSTEPRDADVPAHGSDTGEDAGENDAGTGENGAADDYDDTNLFSMKPHKAAAAAGGPTRKKHIRRRGADEQAPQLEAAVTPMDAPMDEDAAAGFYNEDPLARKRRLLEERMDQAVRARAVKRRRADEDDLERMQDDRIDELKNRMIEAANVDVDRNSQGQIATEKVSMLREVMDTMAKADLAILILDNNLLEAVRLWLEPLPDAAMPAYQIQKELLHALANLPVKTDHLVASGIGKVLVFYQRSTRTEPSLKKLVDRLIGEWTRPILNKLDSYKDRTIRFNDYNRARFANKLALQRNKPAEAKSLYEQQAERRNRAAIPSARTTAYKIAPRVDPSALVRQQRGTGEMFTRINRKMTNSRKKVVKKTGPSIEGKHLSM